MRMQPRWLAMAVSAAALLLLTSSPAAAQRRSAGGAGGRPYNAFGAPGGGFGYGARGGTLGFIAGSAYGSYGYPPVYAPGFAGDNGPPDSYQSFYPPSGGPPAKSLMQYPIESVPPPKAATAAVQIYMVDPNADLWFNGVKMQQTGRQRDFITPELQPGKSYSYEVRAKWTQNGKQYDKTRTLTVQAGEQIGLNFVVEEREALPPPTPKQ
jgi:uncharacterized protein (TIGR03000 family)